METRKIWSRTILVLILNSFVAVQASAFQNIAVKLNGRSKHKSKSPQQSAVLAWQIMPIFANFGRLCDEFKITLIAQLPDKKHVLVDRCSWHKEKNVGWVVEKCRIVEISGRNRELRKLKRTGATPDFKPDLYGFAALFDTARKGYKRIRRVEGKRTKDKPESYSWLDDVKADMKKCTRRRYDKLLKNLPKVVSIGKGLLFVELDMTTVGKYAGRVKLALVHKKNEGWQIAYLLVRCY